MPCVLRVLGWVSGNWNPFKGTRRLPRVDLSGLGRDNFIGIWAPVFEMNLSCLSPVDIGNPILLKSSCVSLVIEHSFPFEELIHHHHDEDEADLKEVKLMKWPLRHFTIFHHLSFGFNWNLKFHQCYFRHFALNSKLGNSIWGITFEPYL